MSKHHIPIVLAALILAPVAVAARADPPSTVKKPLICRKAPRVTGTHIRVPRVCHTAEEWERIDNVPLPVSLRVNQSQNEGGRQRAQ